MKAKSLFTLATASIVAMSLLGPSNTAMASENTTEGTSRDQERTQTAEIATIGSSSPETAIEAIAPETLHDVADVSVSAEGIQHDVGDISAFVPSDPEQGISLSAEGGAVEVSLPFGSQAEPLETTVEGVLAFDNGNDTATAAVVHDDGSIQVNTVIDGANSPTRYDYGLDLPEAGRVVLNDDGTVTVVNAEGGFVAGVAAPWARDANGKSIPTRYEVNGSTLTQVVDHTTATGIEYPVVADPWFGGRLFQTVKRTTYRGDYKYSAWVTGWGAVVLSGGGGIGGYLAGGAIFRSAGWEEWTKAWPAITNKATLKQQFDCHVAAGVYGLPFTQDYNLERFRANRSNWPQGVLSHRCNW